MIRRELHLLGDVRLSGDRRTIGRSIDCDVRLEDDEISQLHAVLERCGEGWRLIDQNGSRGLRVNGRKITEATLVPGDVIDIRPFSMNYLDDRAEGQTAASDRSIHLSFTGVVPTYVRDSQDAGSVIQQRLEDLYAMARLILARKDNGSFWQIMHAALQRCLAADRCGGRR
ncbi:MAG: FHA domain-containing protein [Planctomycetes bacterium]|nr:FHA domain-containing protein [Planctomycetota bacterium]